MSNINNMRFEYIPDKNVDQELDYKIRMLLCCCFTKQQDTVFKTQRFFKEMPAHRYLLWSDENKLVAHVAVHDKSVMYNDTEYAIAGIAEVCVHPDYRNKGMAKLLLSYVDNDRKKKGDAFSVLFGDADIYRSSGYQQVKNILEPTDNTNWEIAEYAMSKPLNMEWPQGKVFLECGHF